MMGATSVSTAARFNNDLSAAVNFRELPAYYLTSSGLGSDLRVVDRWIAPVTSSFAPSGAALREKWSGFWFASRSLWIAPGRLLDKGFDLNLFHGAPARFGKTFFSFAFLTPPFG